MNAHPALSDCDREPIQSPGAVQPHGLLLVADPTTLRVEQAAGAVETMLNVSEWQGAALASLIGADLAAASRTIEAATGVAFLGRRDFAGAALDVSAHLSAGRLIVELEPAAPEPVSAAAMLAVLERAVTNFERAPTVDELFRRAAAEFRALTGYDRVMIYRFLDEGAGAVVAEDKRADMHAFLHHHFPATDIPRQARALYLRNLIRVIPDADYEPQPLRPEGGHGLDMSDCLLRSVSPVHLRYLENMGVAASASISVVRDGGLWGLVACHNETPKHIPYDTRAACRALAGALSRHIRAKEEAEGYRERIRLRGFEDETVALLARQGSMEEAIAHHLGDVGRILSADGVAVLRGADLVTHGSCPPEPQLRALAGWAAGRSQDPVFATECLAAVHPDAAGFADVASGLLAITLSAEEPWVVLWFRAEEVQVIDWAGNPHKGVALGPGEVLTPRASFEAWRETIRGRARRWTVPEVEAAGRLRLALLEVRRGRQLRELNRQLIATLTEKDALLQEKEFLIGEVNHRVQNSLQLVSSFLALQARASEDPGLQAALEEARRRLTAVALVHRRLYRGDQIELIDVARYIEELCADMVASVGEEWRRHMALDLAPLLMPADRAVTVGLVLTELIINATKYAYAGAPGPLAVVLADERHQFRLVVADQGGGRASPRRGFGSRMIAVLVAQLRGEIEYSDNAPGFRVTVTAPTGGAERRV